MSTWPCLLNVHFRLISLSKHPTEIRVPPDNLPASAMSAVAILAQGTSWAHVSKQAHYRNCSGSNPTDTVPAAASIALSVQYFVACLMQKLQWLEADEIISKFAARILRQLGQSFQERHWTPEWPGPWGAANRAQAQKGYQGHVV